jgi:hypothetical protein
VKPLVENWAEKIEGENSPVGLGLPNHCLKPDRLRGIDPSRMSEADENQGARERLIDPWWRKARIAARLIL